LFLFQNSSLDDVKNFVQIAGDLVNWDIRDVKFGMNALMVCLQASDNTMEDKQEKIMYLLDQNVFLGNECDFEGNTIAHFAANQGSEVIALLEEKFKEQLDFNVLNDDLTSPLGIAAACGNTDVVSLLLKSGAQLDLEENRESDGVSPVFLALLNDHFELVMMFIEKIKKSRSKYQYLLDSLSHLAIIKGEMEIIRAIFSAGADVNLQNEAGDTCLHIAYELNLNEVIEYLTKTLQAKTIVRNKENKLPRDMKPLELVEKTEQPQGEIQTTLTVAVSNDPVIHDKKFYESKLLRKLSVLFKLYSEGIIDNSLLRKYYEDLRKEYKRDHNIDCDTPEFQAQLSEEDLNLVRSMVPRIRRTLVVAKTPVEDSRMLKRDYSSLVTLPTEIIFHIISYLDLVDCLSLSIVNKRFLQIIDDMNNWKANCECKWPEHVQYLPHKMIDWKFEFMQFHCVEKCVSVIQNSRNELDLFESQLQL